MTVSVGAASAAPLELLGASAFLAMVPDDALLFANEKEAAVLVGTSARRPRTSRGSLAGDGRRPW